MLVVVMGVSGSGKTTLGRALAAQTGWLFLDADMLHSAACIEKMRRGEALDDADRAPWLARINERLRAEAAADRSVVLACSALRAEHRRQLASGLGNVRFVHPVASEAILAARLAAREHHFAGPALLASQLASLEDPADALRVDATEPVSAQLAHVLAALGLEAVRAYDSTVIVAGLAFPEGPRWHDEAFWFTDQHARTVCRLEEGDRLSVLLRTPDLPGGLAWLPDGTALVVHMTERRIMTVEPSPKEYVDLSREASFHCNDLIATPEGRLYVGNFGFDLHGGEAPKAAELLLVQPDRRVETFCRRVVFPNGCALTPDGRTLLVAESFGHRITAFALDDDGRIAGRSCWAELGERTPDGICLDAEGALCIASPGTGELVRVAPGGRVLARCRTIGTPYACMLGGPDRRELYVCTAETDDPAQAAARRSGRIERAVVRVPGAGWP